MEGRVINTGEVASSRGLVLFGSEGKAVHVDTFIRATGVGLVRLDPGEVGSFALREAILAVELELGSDDGVLAPAMHVKGGLREDERAGIRHGGLVEAVGGRAIINNVCVVGVDGGRVDRGVDARVDLVVRVAGRLPVCAKASGAEI